MVTLVRDSISFEDMVSIINAVQAGDIEYYSPEAQVFALSVYAQKIVDCDSDVSWTKEEYMGFLKNKFRNNLVWSNYIRIVNRGSDYNLSGTVNVVTIYELSVKHPHPCPCYNNQNNCETCSLKEV